MRPSNFFRKRGSIITFLLKNERVTLLDVRKTIVRSQSFAINIKRKSHMREEELNQSTSIIPKVLGIIQQARGEAIKFTVSPDSVSIFKNDQVVLTLDKEVFRQLDANEIIEMINKRGFENVREG
jgi:hypothetical protein